MNDLGQTILVLAIQLSFPLLGGLLLSYRRSPGVASSVLTAAVLGVCVLTALAIVPKPTWPTPVRTVEPINASASVDSIPSESPPVESATGSAPAFDLRRLFTAMNVSAPIVEEPSPRLGRWLVVVFGLVTGFGLIRYLIESREIRRIVCASRVIAHGPAVETARELGQKLGLATEVTLRESSLINGAATAGIWKPCVLLSPEWREWSPDELRSAIAHELAHIVRRDFLTRRLARFTRLIHGYHPLVHWLTRRQELCQELAADALAARCLEDRDV